MSTFAQQLGLVEEQPLIEWYHDQLKASGITTEMADHAGITMEMDGIRFQYHDIEGKPVNYHNLKLRWPVDGRKYCFPAGVPATAYWPRVAGIDHSILYNDLDPALYITEGEKKTVALQAELKRQGLAGHVLGIGGVTHLKAVKTAIKGIPFKLGDARRRVYIVFDWNKENLNVDREQYKLYEELTQRGADVVLLRWATDSAAEMKIDDFIAAGGDLALAIQYSLDHPASLNLPYSHEYFNANYAKYMGDVIQLDNAHIYTTPKFKSQYSERKSKVAMDGKVVTIKHTDQWLDWAQVPKIRELFFEPVGIGKEGVTYPEVRDGRLNLFTGWDTMEDGDVQPWLDLLQHLFKDDAGWVSCWIAHIFQHPEQRPATYINLYGIQGSGKGLLTEILAKMIGDKYAAKLKAKSFNGDFNGDMLGKLLGYSDESKTRSNKEQEALSEKVKELVGNDQINVEGKRKDAITADTYMRVMFTTNRPDAVLLEEGDRRAACFEE